MSQFQPFEPPVPVASQFTCQRLRMIASRQRALLVCILADLVMVAMFALPGEFEQVLGIGVLAAGAVSAIFVFMLAVEFFGTATGVVLGIITLVPLAGLVAMLYINSRAIRTMRKQGVIVGFLGADPNAIE